MNNERERNEHFKGFAELLLNDLKPDITGLFIALGSPLSSRDEEIEQAQRLLMLKVAQRAYDLMYFLLDKAPLHSGSFDVGWGTPDEIRETIKMLPDLTEWPNPQ